ncbi:hypothetical protein [Halarcobacter sp.]|uniref:hypothetical protein n=1 Tax=Halarcobacter sp. TaxID=2321133 RepID=UPI0029F4D159|nr:hypothetical protein [Halarcobacter sp.]
MQHLKITDEIKNLDISNIEENLFFYKYSSKNIKPLLKSGTHDISVENMAAYNSFKGEVYENIIYEFLLDYASKNDSITQFVLKGPHQNKIDKFYKTGLMIDRSLQIVYKSNYKDISEFDALFFTEDALYFVEMSTSKKTVSLNKRLDKKYALLKVLFPNIHIRALIVLTEGTVGLKRFPSFCTIWITKDLEDDELLKKLVFNRKKNGFVTKYKDKKYIEAYTIEHSKFIYFQTLEWILKRCRVKNQNFININFFKNKKLSLYFDIYTKLYIGFMDVDEFLSLVPSYSDYIESIFITIEKINSKEFDIVYYVKNQNGKLRRVRLTKKEISIKEKELDGFTNAEVRFMKYLKEEKYYLNKNQVSAIKEKIEVLKP